MPRQMIDAEPRKTPRQGRSRATVDAVLIAATQVLAEVGCQRANTARIAERAGVSVGSLYQYFPNKEALIAALVERFADDLVERMAQALDRADSLEQAMRALLEVGVSGHRVNPALHKILSEQAPHVGRIAKAMDTHSRIAGLIANYLSRNADKLASGRDPLVAATVVETVMAALVHRSIVDGAPELADGALQREALNLVLAYLQPPGV